MKEIKEYISEYFKIDKEKIYNTDDVIDLFDKSTIEDDEKYFFIMSFVDEYDILLDEKKYYLIGNIIRRFKSTKLVYDHISVSDLEKMTRTKKWIYRK